MLNYTVTDPRASALAKIRIKNVTSKRSAKNIVK